jgi:hypothetical protein
MVETKVAIPLNTESPYKGFVHSTAILEVQQVVLAKTSILSNADILADMGSKQPEIQ